MAAVATLLVAAALFFLVRGCAFLPWNRGGRQVEVRVTVTRDFGTVILRDTGVWAREGDTAMQALQEAADVETAYGGGFIAGIDGLRSRYGSAGGGGEEMDWFFYANGQMADVGAAAYTLNQGDWLVFDYHPWGYSMFTSFLVGCFPELFRNGYGGVRAETATVLYTPGGGQGAEEMARLLEGEGLPCRLRPLETGWSPGEGEYAAVVGIWKEMEDNVFLEEVQSNAARLGLYAYFRAGTLRVLDAEGREAAAFSHGAGLVEGTGPRLGDGRSVLLVVGLDEEGLHAALSALHRVAEEGRPVLGWLAVAGEGVLAVPGEVR